MIAVRDAGGPGCVPPLEARRLFGESYVLSPSSKAIRATGVEIGTTPYRSPNCNAHAEWFVRSIKDECLDRLMLFGEGNLLKVSSGNWSDQLGEQALPMLTAGAHRP